MAELRTVAQIDAEIAQAQEQLGNVRGTTTEVYARIVGYYRSVRNWNKGKRDEYDLRKQFVWDSKQAPQICESASESNKIENTVVKTEVSNDTGEVYYEYFSRKTCPNCQPVKKHLESLETTGIHIDVDTPEGLERASNLGVVSTPTVVVFNSAGTEVGRAHTVSELTQAFSVTCECVA